MMPAYFNKWEFLHNLSQLMDKAGRSIEGEELTKALMESTRYMDEPVVVHLERRTETDYQFLHQRLDEWITKLGKPPHGSDEHYRLLAVSHAREGLFRREMEVALLRGQVRTLLGRIAYIRTEAAKYGEMETVRRIDLSCGEVEK